MNTWVCKKLGWLIFLIIIIVRSYSRAVSNCLNPPVIWLLVFNFDPLLCTKNKIKAKCADFIFFFCFTLTLEHAQIYNSILSITFTKKKNQTRPHWKSLRQQHHIGYRKKNTKAKKDIHTSTWHYLWMFKRASNKIKLINMYNPWFRLRPTQGYWELQMTNKSRFNF